ncbi:MAG TPA: DUF2232 domain-containing protein [Gemmatimonadales bacterium]|nr:DUF2232 domain-containing protein [Gemmatimonadales bacterium]
MEERPGGRWGQVLVLAGFLLFAPPMFLFGPLAALLLVSRPGTLREWVWLLGALGWSALWLQQAGGLGAQFARSAAVLVSGCFLALTLWRPSNGVCRALTATAGAALALAVWMIGLGVRWATLQAAVEEEMEVFQTAMRRALSGSEGWSEMSRQVSLMADTISLLYPGLLALAAIAGLRLAWAWYHRIADRPVGAPPLPFPAFGFSDQLIWGWVIGLALALVPEPSWAAVAGANVLLVWGALYAMRGLAVMAFFGRQTPPAVLVAVAIVTLILLPFVLGGLTIVGLADTWLDFRRRLAPATGGEDR